MRERPKLTFGGVSHRSHELQNEDDLCQDVILQLIRHLDSLRQSRDLYAIMNFEGYVARCAQNAYSSYVRSKNPIRWRFKNRVRYFLNHQLEVEMWEHNPGQMVCGFPGWRHRTPPPAANHVASSWEEFVSANTGTISRSRKNLTPLIVAILHWQGKPIVVDELVGMVAELIGVRDPHEIESAEDNEAAICELLPDPSPDIATQLEQKLYLERLWAEICQLPQKQRVALLLNLRDSGNNDALILFTLMGITSLRKIAQVLEIQLDAMTELWNQLPLNDNAIATRLSVTRQQVINYRKSAKERLARRMG